MGLKKKGKEVRKPIDNVTSIKCWKSEKNKDRFDCSFETIKPKGNSDYKTVLNVGKINLIKGGGMKASIISVESDSHLITFSKPGKTIRILSGWNGRELQLGEKKLKKRK